MIVINNNKYLLALLDTCIIGKLLKNENHEIENFFNLVPKNNGTLIPAISVWSILEIKKKIILYKKFIEFFSVIPFCLLKPPNLILDEEISNYSKNKRVDPILTTFSFLKKPEEQIQNFLDMLFSKPEVRQAELLWESDWKQEVLDSILSLKQNFNPKGKYYNSQDAINFVKLGVPQYLGSQKSDWVKEQLINSNEIIIDAFPSVKITFFNVFFRFYLNNRAPEKQDIFDLTINNPVPYVDYVFTEKFQSDIFQRVKKIDNFINHLEIMTLKDLY